MGPIPEHSLMLQTLRGETIPSRLFADDGHDAEYMYLLSVLSIQITLNGLKIFRSRSAITAVENFELMPSTGEVYFKAFIQIQDYLCKRSRLSEFS